MSKEINLISDTVTRPTPEMLDFMMKAEVGDDVFDSDPSVKRLQQLAADMFGMEAALFFPSGTMANQAAIKLHSQPGEQLICDKWAHVYNYEGGGAAFNSGVSCLLLDGTRGMFTAEQVRGAIHDPMNIHLPKTAMVAVENTTNKGGGGCWDLEALKEIKAVCAAHNLNYHLDGARLFNALVAKGQKPSDFQGLFDTISMCLSKGLGAPVGSLLLGSQKDMARALRIRKLFGGAMRQVGYMAAAGIYALEHNVERLAEDHRRAKMLAKVLAERDYVKKVEPVETNILIFQLKDPAKEEAFMAQLKDRNILMISMGEAKLRLVTHLDFDDKQLEIVIDTLEQIKL